MPNDLHFQILDLVHVQILITYCTVYPLTLSPHHANLLFTECSTAPLLHAALERKRQHRLMHSLI